MESNPRAAAGKVLADLPGKLLHDVHVEEPPVIHAPRSRVIVRWLVAVALVGLLFGLVGWDYTTSSELASSIQVARFYQPTLDQVKAWEDNDNAFQCDWCAAERLAERAWWLA
jgi:hypothetical protein